VQLLFLKFINHTVFWIADSFMMSFLQKEIIIF